MSRMYNGGVANGFRFLQCWIKENVAQEEWNEWEYYLFLEEIADGENADGRTV